MDLLTVDKEKCLRCGICVETCPAYILDMSPEGPACHMDRGCMACGHCVAVCPVGALSNKYCSVEEQRPITRPVPEAEAVYDFLRSRRSIRTFKAEPPKEEEILKLLEVCRYIPSATNSQCIYYTVVRDREKMKAITEATIAWLESRIEANDPNKRYYKVAVAGYKESGKDIICRNAPAMVFMYTKRLNGNGVYTADYVNAYAQLYAPSLGLGTCVAGFVAAALVDGYQPLLDLLQLPPKHKYVGAFMVGYPKYKFRRMPERQHLKVDFI